MEGVKKGKGGVGHQYNFIHILLIFICNYPGVGADQNGADAHIGNCGTRKEYMGTAIRWWGGDKNPTAHGVVSAS